MILDIFGTISEEPSASPFCNKTICLLEMGNFDYELRILSDPRKAPKLKFPVLHDGDKAVADSEFIRRYLEEERSADFDKGLNDNQKAISRMVIRAMDEHFYFILLSNRWMEEKNWEHVKNGFFDSLPFPLKQILPGVVRKDLKKALHGQGIGRHSFDEQLYRAKQDIDSIVELLGKNKFLFGKSPTAADASVVPMLRSAINLVPKLPLSNHILEHKTLMAYLDRGKDAMYPKQSG